jgi:nucleoside-diphosphate-sugar epimerase
MNILVTGSAGMIGSYVVKGLIEKGHTVIGVDRVKPKEDLNGLNPVVLDLSSKEAIMQLFDDKKIDRCIHLAALAHTKGVADTSWEAFKKVNVDCAENIFEACEKHNVPVLFISTVDAIGMVKANSCVGKIYITPNGTIQRITIDLIALPPQTDLTNYT